MGVTVGDLQCGLIKVYSAVKAIHADETTLNLTQQYLTTVQHSKRKPYLVSILMLFEPQNPPKSNCLLQKHSFIMTWRPLSHPKTYSVWTVWHRIRGWLLMLQIPSQDIQFNLTCQSKFNPQRLPVATQGCTDNALALDTRGRAVRVCVSITWQVTVKCNTSLGLSGKWTSDHVPGLVMHGHIAITHLCCYRLAHT